MSVPTGAVLEAALLEAPALLERAVAYTRSSLALLPRAAPGAATPCSQWDLVRLLRHMDDGLAAFTEAAESGYVAPAGPAEGHPALLAASLRDRACRLLGAWAHEPGRPAVSVVGRDLSTTVLAATGALEITVHGWDVARACGEDRPIPEELAATLLAVAPLVVRADDRPGRFAAPHDVPPTADASTRLLAYLGRR
jgi:uncharacterized protein (TIGR03086 family)